MVATIRRHVNYDESKHPRDWRGRWAAIFGGGGSSKPEPKRSTSTPGPVDPPRTMAETVSGAWNRKKWARQEADMGVRFGHNKSAVQKQLAEIDKFKKSPVKRALRDIGLGIKRLGYKRY